jgi:soluble cytochrome b562
MKRSTARLWIPTACLLALAPAAWAADAFTDAMQAAYAPYRAALFRTNSGDAAASRQTLEQARQAWAGVVRQFPRAPVPYDRDPSFSNALADVAAVYDKAMAEVEAGKLPQAHDSLEGVRDILAQLRERNQVVVYSDHMNAYHEVMEHALAIDKATLDQPEGRLAAMAQAGVLEHLAEQLRHKAPEGLKAQTEFGELLDALQTSVKRYKDALMHQDGAAAKDALGKLKAPYSKLFLKFG